MNPELKAQWLAALRSGKYEQGQGMLRQPIDGTFCATGVLADLIGYDLNRYRYNIDNAVLKEIGLKPWQAGQIATYNDVGWTFDEIADWIEARL